MPTREDFEMALTIAQGLYQKQDPEKQAEKAGASWVPSGDATDPKSGHAVVRFLKTPYVILPPDGEVRYQEGEKEPAGARPALHRSFAETPHILYNRLSNQDSGERERCA